MMAVLIPLATGLLCGALLLLSAGSDPGATACAYLFAFVWVLSISLGALIVAMVCDACGSVWFVAVRRAAEVGASALPALALLFVPLLAALPLLYPWAGPLPVAAHPHALVLHRLPYLNPSAFAERAALAFACWIVIAELLRHWSLRQDVAPSGDLSHRRRVLAAAGLIPIAFTVTSAAVDWIMSLDATWTSSIVGLQLLVGAFAAGTSAIILVEAGWGRRGQLTTAVGAEHRHALGKLLFTSLVLWMYLSFMQLLVVWMGDLPDEAAWYLPRLAGTWGLLALTICLLHFVVPFAVLLPRSAKRNARVLAAMAGCVLVAHGADLAWLILPSGPAMHWTNGAWRCAVALLAVGGIAWAMAAWRRRGIDPCPRGDPDLPDALAYRSLP